MQDRTLSLVSTKLALATQIISLLKASAVSRAVNSFWAPQ